MTRSRSGAFASPRPGSPRSVAAPPWSSPIGLSDRGSTGVYSRATRPCTRGWRGSRVASTWRCSRRAMGPAAGSGPPQPFTAVDAAALVGARTVIPIHWGTLYLPDSPPGVGIGVPSMPDAFARKLRADARPRRPRPPPGELTEVHPSPGGDQVLRGHLREGAARDRKAPAWQPRRSVASSSPHVRMLRFVLLRFLPRRPARSCLPWRSSR